MLEDLSFVVHGSSTTEKFLNSLLRSHMSTITIHFDCAQKLDKNGYFHYIGTRANTKTWRNPHTSGFIRVQYSPLNSSEGYNNPADVVGDKPGKWGSGHDDYCKNKQHVINIDLLDNPPICPDYYTIAHTYEGWSGRLKNWNLEASNDKVKWDVLREHRDEEALMKASYHRELNEGGWHIEDCHTYYRYFRVMQKGPNSDGQAHMVIGRLELYGTIRVTKMNKS